ncbi:MAG TPA: hypothetical protein PKW49_13540 [Paludibacteraceae bacterium]|nr:hypothetical protein [Paludibacteraceae bacterium]
MEDISTNVTIKGDSIFITETGIDTLNANCICPYDITTQFKGVEKKLYHVIINPGFIDRCSFDIDLRKQTEGGWKKPKGEFLSHTDCKNGGDKELRADVYSSTIFKAKYNFDLSKGTGTITHIDAVHNCCPEDITTFVRIEGDSIFISESEYGGICKCVCPYDVVSTFSNIEKKVYHVQMKGGIEFSYNTYVDFDIDLTKQTEGEWTKDLNNEEIKGSFLRVSDCKGSPYEEDSLRSAFNDFKASYTFDMQKGVGTITHVNAVYNCCPGKLYTSVEVVGNNITINEINEPDEYTCNCDCTYDLSTQLEGVKEGIYHIKIVDYRGTHSFDIDLSKETEGTFSGTYE